MLKHKDSKRLERKCWKIILEINPSQKEVGMDAKQSYKIWMQNNHTK